MDQLEELVNESKSVSQTLYKGLLVLQAVAQDHPGRGVRLLDISQKLGIHKSTAHRLLATLVMAGYVEQDEDSDRYRLGLKLLSLSTSLLNSLEVRSQASALLNELMLKTNHAVHLVVLDPKTGEAIYIDKVDSPQPVRMYTYIGSRFPANCTAAGKAILAHLPQQQLQSLLSDLRRQTPFSVVSPEALQAELQQVRLLGYATDDEENALGIRCIGAPILDGMGRVIASISISAASAYLPKEDFSRIAPLVVEAAQRVSQRMGYRL